MWKGYMSLAEILFNNSNTIVNVLLPYPKLILKTNCKLHAAKLEFMVSTEKSVSNRKAKT
jgi:hypothetical protein